MRRRTSRRGRRSAAW